jgi:uncharacterized protein
VGRSVTFRIRDPIHNFVTIPDELMPLVNTSALQRLRGIRQLALANLVYPGALHTRFDHTLGVTHVAGMMAEQLKIDAGELRLVLLAALLHDIGHGPFSHVSEESLSRFADRTTLKEGQKDHKIHEVVTAEIIRTDAELGKLLKEEERNNVCTLLKQGFGRPILKQIVSGPLDADKQDYLLRDSRFCGVEYGKFDLHQLQRSLLLDEEDLMIDPDGVHAVEQFVLAKYHMTANVYRHRVRLITDQMIGRAITLGIDVDGLEQLRILYRFNNSPEFIRNYQKWDDARFLEVFCPRGSEPPGKASGEVLRRLRERDLLKRAFSERIDVLFDPRFREMLKELPEPKRDHLRGEIETGMAEFLSKELAVGVDSRMVIAHSFGIKSVRESSRNEEEGILVKEAPTPKPFIEASTLFKSINSAYSDRFVEVYAPIRWPDPGTKKTLREKWKDSIRGIIENACRAEKKATP